jgi:hypothetical protein
VYEDNIKRIESVYEIHVARMFDAHKRTIRVYMELVVAMFIAGFVLGVLFWEYIPSFIEKIVSGIVLV